MLVLGWMLGSGGLFAGAATGEIFAGRSLEQALRVLQADGLKIFFTSNVVRPEMRVEAEPTAGEPRARLDQLLAPHGLISKAGPGGRLVVVTDRSAVSSIHGQVRVRLTEVALGGVRVVIPGTSGEAISDQDGGFLLDQLAAGTYTLEAHLPGFVVERFEQISVAPGEALELRISLQPAPMALDEIVVTPSLISLLREEPVTGLALGRDEIFALPHLGDDVYRAFTLLPGVSGEEVSARFNVRGGRSDEVLMLLDGVELYEPFHLKDYGSALSIITPKALAEVNLMTGGFPAEYGDRMSGVLDMSTVQADRRQILLGLGLLSAEVGSTGTYGDRRGQWLASLRRGQLDLALRFLGQREQPKYWDAFAKTEYQVRPEHRLGLHVLHSDDSLDFFNIEPDNSEDYLTSYGNSYAWITHQAIIGSRLVADTTVSVGRVDRDRRSQEVELEVDEEGAGFSLIDRRALEAVGIKQDWDFTATDSHYLQSGFDLRRLSSDYDYFNQRYLDDPLAEIRFEPRTGTTSFVRHLRGEQYSGYLSDRYRPFDALTMELGLRYDQHTLTADNNFSPRLNLVYAPPRAATGSTSALRLAWGYFFQTQRPYELQVEDGVHSLASAERTEQRVIGFERTIGAGSDVLLRVEAYQRLIKSPRPRYENIFQPVEIFPEIEPDRILFAPESSRSYGLEIFIRGTAGVRFDWWASYAFSRVLDRIDGAEVARRIDQPHAFSFDVNYRAGEHWNLNLAWQYHTGWPITPLAAVLEEDDEGEPQAVAVLGPINSQRLPDYHRLDLRASREKQTKRGVLGFFIEIQNLYDRRNVAGFDPDFELEEGPDGELDIILKREIWGRFLPSFGITWQF